MSECRACLVKCINVRMHSICNTRYKEMYEKLSGTKLRIEDGSPNTICNTCNLFVKKCFKFIDMSLNSEKVLTKRLLDVEMSEGTQGVVDTVIIKTTSVQPMSYVNDREDNEPEVTVTIKEEPLDFDECDAIKEEYLDTSPSEETLNDDTAMETVQGSYHPEATPAESDKSIPWPNYTGICYKNETNEATNTEETNAAFAQSINLQNLSEALEIIALNTSTELKYCPKTAKTRNRDSNYFCSICNYSCHAARTLRKHSKVHDPTYPFSCKFCSYRFIDEKKLSSHTNYCTVCNVCGKRFSNLHGLRIHIRLHTGEQPYTCESCGRSFNQKTNLQTHLRVHSREKQYPCEVCHKTFPFSTFLQRHMLLHGDNSLDIESSRRIMNCHKPFVRKKKRNNSIHICSVCGKMLQSKDGLNQHMRLHSGERPFSCESCNRGFNQKCNLHTHVERVHAGDELFSCKVCFKMFPLNCELKRHLVSHTEGKLSARDFEMYQQKHIFMVHRRVHTGQPVPYPCDMCKTRVLSY